MWLSDIFYYRKKFRKNVQDWELMIVGRLCVIFLVFVSILWIPILQVKYIILHRFLVIKNIIFL